jgi:hypothetical protein
VKKDTKINSKQKKNKEYTQHYSFIIILFKSIHHRPKVLACIPRSLSASANIRGLEDITMQNNN